VKKTKMHTFLVVISVTSMFLLASGTEAEEEKYENPKVIVKTNLGSFTVELFEREAPITVKNFLNYVDKDFYSGTTFHRVMENFMIQGGGFTADGMRKATSPPIKNEAKNGLSNLKGTLAMARTNEIHSATSQFFINVKDNTGLDHKNDTDRYGYAVFGKVIEGLETIEKIRTVETKTKKGDPRKEKSIPVKPVIITSMSRVEKGKKPKED
jgi:cyclophilin family peptidyl-prolyl cis-trans isomerase